MFGVGIGIGVGRHRFAGNFADSYSERVLTNGGVIESLTCVANASTLLQQASWLLIPSGYKEDVVYAQNPSNGDGDLTWTRASDACRTYSDGTIRRTPWNLLQQSEDFSNAYWTKLDSTISTNTTTSPDGTLTADKLIDDSDNTTHYVTNIGNFTIGTTYKLSIYAKASEKNWIAIGFNNQSNSLAWFNLSSGTVGTAQSSISSTSIQSVGNGWYRCSITCTAILLNPYPSFIVANADNTLAYGGDGVSGIFIWGSQINEGSLLPYFPTTNRLDVPRLSYMYGSCPSLLLEPQRTNLILYSEDFSNAYWTKLDSTISTNTTTSPDGTLTADKLIDDSDNTTHYVTNIGNFTIGTTYKLSIYAKASEKNWIAIGFNNQSNSLAWFNLSSGTVGTVQSNISATSIESVGNGWYRCSITCTITASNPYPSFIVANANNTLAYAGDGVSGIFIWGSQMEDKTYATTYIPTTTATATRLADVFTRDNIYTNALISASGGTWYIELKNNINYIRDSIGTAIGLGDTANFASGNCFTFRNGSSTPNELEIFKRVSGTISPVYQSLPVNAKIAIKWNGSTADVFVNGTKVVSATPFTGINMEYLGAPTITQPTFIQAMALFNTPLSDANCQLLTT